MPVSRKLNHPRLPEIFNGGISIIGPGRWGSSLYAALARSGTTPLEVIGTSPKKAGCGLTTPVVGFDEARFDAELLWLCVPDSEIAGVAGAIVARRPSLRGQTVVHSSGVYSSALLAEAVRAGARVASVHPLMTFPTRRPTVLAGVPFAIEATGALAVRLEKLVTRIGGTPFRLPATGKALYHAAAVMASPLLVSLAAAARQTMMQAGLTGKEANALLEPIMTATLRNFFCDGGARSFSGPFARGDVDTVSLHLQALKAHPFLQALYKALAEHAIEVLPVMKKQALQKKLAAAKTNILS